MEEFKLQSLFSMNDDGLYLRPSYFEVREEFGEIVMVPLIGA